MTKEKEKNLVRVDTLEKIRRIHLNYPEKKNAMVDELKLGLRSALEETARDAAIRAVLLTAEGDSFCAGGDVNGLLEVSSAVEGRKRIQGLQEIIRLIVTMEKPVVAAVQGYAVGAGCNLALACDIVFAAEHTRFSEIFSNLGLIPDGGGLYLLPRLIGVNRAKEMIFSARMMDGKEAHAIGMVNFLTEEKNLTNDALEYARMLANRPTTALAFSKRILNRTFQTDLETLFELEATMQGVCLRTEDFKEGVSAFKQKRSAHFKGK